MVIMVHKNFYLTLKIVSLCKDFCKKFTNYSRLLTPKRTRRGKNNLGKNKKSFDFTFKKFMCISLFK